MWAACRRERFGGRRRVVSPWFAGLIIIPTVRARCVATVQDILEHKRTDRAARKSDFGMCVSVARALVVVSFPLLPSVVFPSSVRPPSLAYDGSSSESLLCRLRYGQLKKLKRTMGKQQKMLHDATSLAERAVNLLNWTHPRKTGLLAGGMAAGLAALVRVVVRVVGWWRGLPSWYVGGVSIYVFGVCCGATTRQPSTHSPPHPPHPPIRHPPSNHF